MSGHREGWQDTGPTLRPKVPSLRPLPLLLGDLSVVESQPQEPRPGSGGAGPAPPLSLALPGGTEKVTDGRSFTVYHGPAVLEKPQRCTDAVWPCTGTAVWLGAQEGWG